MRNFKELKVSDLKIVYLIMSHTNPEQLLRLVQTLKTGNSTAVVVIHHDYSKSYLDPTVFASMKDVYIMQDFVRGKAGEFSLVVIVLQTIKWIMSHLQFDWLVLISGQDYPVQPLGQIEEFLATTPYDGFMTGVSLKKVMPCGPVECPITTAADRPCADCLDRYYYQYYKIPHFLSSALKRIRRQVNEAQSVIRIRRLHNQNKSSMLIGVRSLLNPFTSEFDCYKGSQWFTLNYRCIQYICQFVDNHPQFSSYYQRTLIPDESFFQTILLNNPALKIFNDNKRFIFWKDSRVIHPEILKARDFNRIIASHHHFARKFDPDVDAEVLNMIDRYILKVMA